MNRLRGILSYKADTVVRKKLIWLLHHQDRLAAYELKGVLRFETYLRRLTVGEGRWIEQIYEWATEQRKVKV